MSAIVAILLPNDSLPADVTVVEGQEADFHCIAHTTEQTLSVFTVAFLVKLPSSNLTQCYNYTFSQTKPLSVITIVKNSSCSDLVSINSESGHREDRTNHLTASWASVNLSLSGAEVVCAQASRGITQWAKTATLTVLPASTTHVLASPTVDKPLRAGRSPKLSALAALSILLLGGVVLLATLLWWRHRRRTMAKTNQQQQEDQSMNILTASAYVLFPNLSSLPLSFCLYLLCSSPDPTLPAIQCLQHSDPCSS